MNQELIQSLSVITEEEQKILAGSADIDRTLYMDREDMVIDSDKLLEAGQLITGRIRVNRDSEHSFEQQLTLQVLRYIDEHYREGSLTELAALMGYDVYWLSRAINRLLGRNYKELLQIKRLNQAAFLLHSTRMPVADVSFAVGYDNTSYFYRIFRTYYGMSPKEYRKNG